MKHNIPWEAISAHLKGEQSIEQQALFDQWVIKEENTLLYKKIDTLWKEVQSEFSGVNPDQTLAWKKLEDRIKKIESKRVTQRLQIYKIASIAACLLLLISVSYSVYLNVNQPEEGFQSYSNIQGKSKMILPDGSEVWLNTGTTIKYASSFTQNRHIKLSGEASFDVVKNDHRPFIVEAENTKIQVYGTIFNVKAYSKEEELSVALSRGSVSVQLGEEEPQELKPGEIAIINKNEGTLTIEERDVDFELSWAKESLRFEGESLEEICRYLEKWYHVDIELEEGTKNRYYFTFTIKDDPLESILRIMSRINPIGYSFDGNDNVKISTQPTNTYCP